jgi:hypothetical protein
LIVDGVEYRTGQGEVLAALPAELEGEELEARIRFYAVFPFAGTVKGRVRVDHPGFFQAEDETVGEGQLELAADPVDYGTRPREELTIPFMAVADDGLGFYVELFADDTELPWFSTSWDGILPSGVLPFHWPVYKENFGTYGHWPPSLPVAEASEATGTLFVVVREAPDGLGIEGATVTLEGEEGVAGAAGLAGFDLLPAGEYEVAASAAGFAAGDEGTEAVMVVAGQTTWLELFLWAEAPVEPGPETVEPSPEWAEPTPDVVEGLPEHAEVFEELPTPDGVPPADLGTWDGLAEGELPRVEAVSEDSGGPGGCPGCSATPGGAGMGAPLLAGLLALLLGVRRKAGPNMWRTQRD